MCSSYLTEEPSKNTLKEYQQVLILTATEKQKQEIQSVFIEEPYLRQFSSGDYADMYLLYDILIKFKMEKQMMSSSLKPILTLVQANTIKSNDNQLFKFFINLSNKLAANKERDPQEISFQKIMQ